MVQSDLFSLCKFSKETILDGVEGIQNKRQPMLELRSFSHKIKSIGEAEATKAECFEITEKLIKYRKDADLKNKQCRFLHSLKNKQE